MADDKKKAERDFNSQALKEAVERMQPELAAASEATHKYGADNTAEDTDFDRTVAPWLLRRSLDGLCSPHLWLLNEIANALYELPAADSDHADSDHREKTPRHHH